MSYLNVLVCSEIFEVKISLVLLNNNILWPLVKLDYSNYAYCLNIYFSNIQLSKKYLIKYSFRKCINHDTKA